MKINIKNIKYIDRIMDISTRQVLKRTLETTEQHVELDHLVDYEVKWADASLTYKAYNDYDVAEIPVFIPDEEDIKKDAVKIRHTHLPFTDSSAEFKEKMDNMVQFYIDNNLWPASNFFKGPSNQ